MLRHRVHGVHASWSRIPGCSNRSAVRRLRCAWRMLFVTISKWPDASNSPDKAIRLEACKEFFRRWALQLTDGKTEGCANIAAERKLRCSVDNLPGSSRVSVRLCDAVLRGSRVPAHCLHQPHCATHEKPSGRFA